MKDSIFLNIENIYKRKLDVYTRILEQTEIKLIYSTMVSVRNEMKQLHILTFKRVAPTSSVSR